MSFRQTAYALLFPLHNIFCTSSHSDRSLYFRNNHTGIIFGHNQSNYNKSLSHIFETLYRTVFKCPFLCYEIEWNLFTTVKVHTLMFSSYLNNLQHYDTCGPNTHETLTTTVNKPLLLTDLLNSQSECKIK